MLPYYLALDPFLQQQQQHHHLTVAYALFLPLPVILSVLSPLLSLSMAAQTVEEGWALPTLPPARLWTPHPTPTHIPKTHTDIPPAASVARACSAVRTTASLAACMRRLPPVPAQCSDLT